jgi:hypothetical protein
MKFLLLIYNEAALLDVLLAGEFDTMMHGCPHGRALAASRFALYAI